MFNDTDVLVAGGGPAGLVAAFTAATAGCSVTVFEQEAEIGTPVHTSGAISIEAMRTFEIPADLYHPVGRIRISSPNESVLFEFPDPVGCVIDVRGVYQHLAARAQEAGARVLTGVSVTRPVLSNDRVVGCLVRCGGVEEEVKSRVVVDASGYRAEIAKGARLHQGFDRFGVGAEYELVAPNCRQDEILLIVGNKYAPAGYAWVFPWGKERVRVGVGLLHADTRADCRKLLQVFLHEIGKFNVDVGDSRIVETHFGMIPAVGLADHISGNGILAVGDAAGVASLVVGEGIRLSMISGQMAGAAAAEYVSHGSFDRKFLAGYETAFRKRFGVDLRIGAAINQRMASWTDSKWDDRVRFLRTVPPGLLVAALQSHFSIWEIWRWLTRNPRLWPRLVRWSFKILRHTLRA